VVDEAYRGTRFDLGEPQQEQAMGAQVLDAHAARRCSVRTQWDVLCPVTPAPTPAFTAGLAAAGVAFKAEVVEQLLAAHCDSVEQLTTDRSNLVGHEAETIALMDAGSLLIYGGRLPRDEAGRRVAEPDLLVRVGDAPTGGVWRYRPVDIKHHTMLVRGTALPAVVWTLAELSDPRHGPALDPEQAARVGRRDSSARDDLLQLAHYHRSLRACGRAAEGPAWAGVIGREQQVVWYELGRSRWQGGTDGRESTLESYDHRFARRLAIADVAEQHRKNPSLPLLVAPVRISECTACPWREHCDKLLQDAGDLSLLPRLSSRERTALLDVGVSTIAELAVLADDIAVEGISDGPLDGFVDAARARLGDQIAYRRQGVRDVRVLRADIELDVDIENLDEVYLWGVQVTDRSGTDFLENGYLPFVTWEEGLSEFAATQLFVQFWSWLTAVQQRCDDAGLSLAAYCWSGPAAENRWMRRYAERSGRLDEVTAYLATPAWVDLEQPFKSRLVTGHGSSLKTVAPMLDFAWRDDDPGGGQSTVWYANAVDSSLPQAARATNRERLLAYNEDDVRATLHVREWLTRNTPFASVRHAVPAPDTA
jgi:predicted RecB family nuclease